MKCKHNKRIARGLRSLELRKILIKANNNNKLILLETSNKLLLPAPNIW